MYKLENPYILLYDRKISSLQTLVPAIEAVAQANRRSLVVADNIEGEVLTPLVVNKLRARPKVVSREERRALAIARSTC